MNEILGLHHPDSILLHFTFPLGLNHYPCHCPRNYSPLNVWISTDKSLKNETGQSCQMLLGNKMTSKHSKNNIGSDVHQKHSITSYLWDPGLASYVLTGSFPLLENEINNTYLVGLS